MQAKLQRASVDHKGGRADAQIEEIFHSYSHLKTTDPTQDQDEDSADGDDSRSRDLEESNAFQAALEVLRTWDCSLTDDEEIDFKKVIFKKVWKETADTKTDKLLMSEAVGFMRNLFDVVL